MQLILYIFALFQAQIGLAIVDKPVRPAATAPLDFVWASIVPNQVDDDFAIFLAFAYKLPLLVWQEIEQGEANCFNNCRLARAIRAADGGRALAQIDADAPIAFDILQVNTSDEHNCSGQPSQEI